MTEHTVAFFKHAIFRTYEYYNKKSSSDLRNGHKHFFLLFKLNLYTLYILSISVKLKSI